MKSQNNKVFVWYKINFLSIFYRYNNLHYFLYCNPTILYILKIFNYRIIKLNYSDFIFDKKKNNLFFECDYFTDQYTRKILLSFKKKTFFFYKKRLIEKIYLSFIGQDIKDSCHFFIRTQNFFLKKYPSSKIFYILNNSEFSNNLCNLLNSNYKNLNFCSYNNYFKKNLFIKVSYLYITLFINIFRKEKIKKKKPTICQEYIDNIFDRYPDAGHLFWINKSNIKFSDIIFFTFNRKLKNFFFKNPITKKNTETINISKFNILKFSDIFENNFYKYVKNFSYNDINFFLLEFYIKYLVEHKKKFIEIYNVKIFHHYQEPNHESLSLAYSCKFTNSVVIWNHWSVDQHPVYYYKYGFCDIFLSWGSWNTSYMNAHNFMYEYIFTTGIIAGDKLNSIGKKEKKNKKKIIIFNSSSDNITLHNPNSLMEDFYQVIFKLALKKKYSFFIKPKRNIYNVMTKGMSSSMRYYVKEKRINLISNLLTPSQVGKYNDLYIAWGHNTAGNIANIQGKNVIYYDNVNLKFHPFANRNFLVKNPNELESKIENYFNDNKKFKLKHYERKYLNEFYDNKNNEKAAFIFEKAFGYLKTNVKKTKALNNLLKDYQIKYGNNKIICKKGKMKTINIWEKELKKIAQNYKRYKKKVSLKN